MAGWAKTGHTNTKIKKFISGTATLEQIISYWEGWYSLLFVVGIVVKGVSDPRGAAVRDLNH